MLRPLSIIKVTAKCGILHFALTTQFSLTENNSQNVDKELEVRLSRSEYVARGLGNGTRKQVVDSRIVKIIILIISIYFIIIFISISISSSSSNSSSSSSN